MSCTEECNCDQALELKKELHMLRGLIDSTLITWMPWSPDEGSERDDLRHRAILKLCAEVAKEKEVNNTLQNRIRYQDKLLEEEESKKLEAIKLIEEVQEFYSTLHAEECISHMHTGEMKCDCWVSNLLAHVEQKNKDAYERGHKAGKPFSY